DQPFHQKLLSALQASKDDRGQQIHYFYCLRLLHEGWTPQQKSDLLAWYDSTKTWTGGFSFTPFLENILRDADPIFTREDREQVIAKAGELPLAAAALLKISAPRQLPSSAALVKV